MIKLIGTDLDGTLLDDNKKASQETLEVFQEAKRRNVIIVAVTGRTLDSVKNVVDISFFDYLILNNGANIYDVSLQRTIFDRSIPKEIAEQITELIDPDVFQFDYCTFRDYHLYKHFNNSKCPFIKEINSLDEVTDSISKINIFLNEGKNVKMIKERIERHFRGIQSFIMQDSGSDKKWIVLTPESLNKKESLVFLGNKLGISLSEMMFFGDGLNDLEVIEAVGVGVAMGNALEEVKEKAKEQTLTNNENGIAYYLKKRY